MNGARAVRCRWLTLGQGRRWEIDVGASLYAVTFSTNGVYLLSGGSGGIRMWRAKDGQEVAAIEARTVQCLAVSNDGKWIGSGTDHGDVDVWNAETCERVFHHWDSFPEINAVDFSPDATRLVSAPDSQTGIVSVWDITSGQLLLSLQNNYRVVAAKFSPQGDRIATAIFCRSVRIYDSHDGCFLLDIPVEVTPYVNTGLLWANDHLFAISRTKIMHFEASSGSLVSDWTVPDGFGSNHSCIALPKHGQFIVRSVKRIATLWETSTHTKLGVVEHVQEIFSISISPDDQFLAISGVDGRITIHRLSDVIVGVVDCRAASREQGQQVEQPSTLESHFPTPRPIQAPTLPYTTDYPIFRDSDLQIDAAILQLWKLDQLTDAATSLTVAINTSPNPSQHLLASRALVRARLREWDAALEDAERALEIHPSVLCYIAKGIAHVGKGEKDKGYQACDIAFAPLHSSHVTFLLFIKAIIVFMAGEHRNAISRLDDLIAMVPFNSAHYVAYMYFTIGNAHMVSGDYQDAVRSFECARAQMRHDASHPLPVVSLISGWKFDGLGTTIRRHLCEALHAAGRTKEAVQCFHLMMSELGGETNPDDEWALKFRHRASKRLEALGDTAIDTQQSGQAISYFTIALSLDPPSPEGILSKRRSAFRENGSWKQALDCANQAITLDPLSPWGYELKHAALHKAKDHGGAVDAFDAMLLKMVQSPDPAVQHCAENYVSPSSTRGTIHRIVQRTIRRLPRVLINITTGRLQNKSEQASAFESLPVFNELVSSMTTRIDHARIKREVRQYYRYVMLSHRWEYNEPLFQEVVHIVLYDLNKSPTHDKLQTFCRIVRDAGFIWAWTDTCCIDKSDHFVLQEALVAMFKWYQGSAMMIVFLRGVPSGARRGALVNSIWNTRAWTLQEYIASKVIHFYTEDWTLYLDLKLPNHKKSPEVIAEMEQATGISAEELMALRPGLTSIREKLRLASTRQTTLVEDAAYSLLGIFSVAGMSAIYGEGEASLGRLLAHILAGSGDVSILAWTGESGSYNSCLPAYITVFDGPATSHLPLSIPEPEMGRMTTALRTTSSFDLDVALNLFDCLSGLPAPWFAASRMKLPCIAFQLPAFSRMSLARHSAYRADTSAFGTVEIRTKNDLSRMKFLYLVHPWLDALLEREDAHGNPFVDEDDAPPLSPGTELETASDQESDDDFWSLSGSESPPAPASASLTIDKETRARQLAVRLRQPFGALLFTLAATDRRATDYRRVATDGVITVRFLERFSLADILDNVRTLDVL